MARLLAKAKEVREALYPVLQQSAFAERGVLTPDEFLKAGDELVGKCPTWAWAAGDASRRKNYLPADKQYLVTKDVPCAQRASTVEGCGEQIETEGDFVVPKVTAPSSTEAEVDDVCASLEEASLQVADDAAAPATLQTRRYDLSITYDKYWQSPRMWLFGYNEQHAPLTQKQTLEDIVSAYALRTVTFERHPHLADLPHASIHPCKHPQAMKRILDQAARNGKGVDPQQALFFFLKFIANMVPTVDYDFTHDVVAG